MNIGNIALKQGAGLAPMAGVTDAAFRLLCAEKGAAWSVSEMLSAKGWVYSQGKNRNALELLTRLPGEGICGLQLFGREPEYIAQAAQELQRYHFDFLDLNFGCPAPKITGNGEGSAMMREPDLIGKVVRAAVEAVPVPVTVKIRAGWDAENINAREVAVICEQAGAKAVAVHGRTRMQQYGGKADWSVIRDVKNAVSIPVLGNGDIRCGADAQRMMDETGCDGVIVGRGAQGNPWLFAEIAAAMQNKPFQPPTPDERLSMIQRHFSLECRIYGEKRGLLEMRKHIAWYLMGLKGAAKVRVQINTLPTIEGVYKVLETYFDELKNEEQ